MAPGDGDLEAACKSFIAVEEGSLVSQAIRARLASHYLVRTAPVASLETGHLWRGSMGNWEMGSASGS